MVSGEATERATAAVVAAMSHELRTPLAAITGSLQLLGEMSLDREEQRLVRIARQSAETLTHLLDDVLELARVDAGAVELAAAEFEPARLLDSVVQLLVPRVTQQRVLLTTELDIALPSRLYMARDRLRQVLLNLASHAIRSNPGGEVAVRLSQGAVGHLRLEVSDNGPALPLARQASVLAPRSRQ
jgi:signal transduction histidine kinase